MSLGVPPGMAHPERISQRQLPYFPDHIGRYRFALQWVPGVRVLDVPCGTGYGSLLLAAAGARAVVGVDISLEAIQEAKSGWVPPNLEYQCLNAEEMRFDEPFDLAVCFEGLEHVPHPDRLLARLADSLTPNGILIISTPNSDAQEGGHSGNPFHVKEFTRSEFESLVSDHFQETRLYFQRRSDPLDQEWSPLRAVKSLVPRPPAGAPVPTPSPAATAPSGSAGEAPELPDPLTDPWLAPGVDDRWYPRSCAYLTYPGMEPGFQPAVFVAVCRGPRR